MVRFAVQNEQVAVLRAEVFNLAGKQLFDSGPVMGNALNWNMSKELWLTGEMQGVVPIARIWVEVIKMTATARLEECAQEGLHCPEEW